MLASITSETLAQALRRHVEEIRNRIQGLASARALIVIENNSLFIAESTKELFDRYHVPNVEFLYMSRLPPQQQPVMTLASSFAGQGLGIFMTNLIKASIMEALDHFIRDRRLQLHRDAITYVTRDANYDAEMSRRLTAGDGDPTATKQRFESGESLTLAIDRLRKAEIRRELVGQLKGMMRIEVRRTDTHGDQRISYRFVGKSTTRDPSTQQRRKDDVVMSLGIMLFTALQIYYNPEYQHVRDRIVDLRKFSAMTVPR